MSSLCRTTTLSAWISCSSSRRSVLGTLFQLQDGSCHKAFGICADVIQQDFQQIVIWCDTVPTNSDYVHAASIYNLPTHQLKINNKWSIEQKWHFLEYPFVSTPRYPLHTIFTTEIGGSSQMISYTNGGRTGFTSAHSVAWNSDLWCEKCESSANRESLGHTGHSCRPPLVLGLFSGKILPFPCNQRLCVAWYGIIAASQKISHTSTSKTLQTVCINTRHSSY